MYGTMSIVGGTMRSDYGTMCTIGETVSIVGGTKSIIYGTMSIVAGSMSSIYGTLSIVDATMTLTTLKSCNMFYVDEIMNIFGGRILHNWWLKLQQS